MSVVETFTLFQNFDTSDITRLGLKVKNYLVFSDTCCIPLSRVPNSKSPVEFKLEFPSIHRLVVFFYFKKLMLNSMQDLKSWVYLLKNYWDFILWSNLAPPFKFHWHINSLIDPIKIVPQRFHRFTDRHCRYLVDVEFDRWHRWWRIYHWRYKCKVVIICEYLMLLPWINGDFCDKKFVDLNLISRLIVYIFLLYHTINLVGTHVNLVWQ